MKPIRITLWSLLAGLSILWMFANLALPVPLNIMAVRILAVQYSGVLAMGAMSMAMILAVRAPLVDRWLNGLDKSYRLHKWLGITALVTSVAHWVFVNGPKWAVDLGLMGTPDRQRPGGTAIDLGAVETFLRGLRDPAEGLGEKAFYVAVLLIAVALIRRIPYRFFARTHTLIAIAYLVLVFHTVVLMDFDAWPQPVGVVTGVLLIGGVAAAMLALTRQIGSRRRVPGKVTGIQSFASMKVTQAEITVDAGWP